MSVTATVTISAEDLWSRHVIVVEDAREFVNVKLLEQIMGTELKNKYRDLKKVISEMVKGTDINPDDLIRTDIQLRNQSINPIYIAAGTMQLILHRGIKGMQWNVARRSMVEHFFPKDMLPYVEPHKARTPMAGTSATTSSHQDTSARDNTGHGNNTTERTMTVRSQLLLPAMVPRATKKATLQRYITDWQKRECAVKFWRQIFWFAAKNKINIQGLVDVVKRNGTVNNRQSRAGKPNLTKTLLLGLTINRGSTIAFCDRLALAMKTGNSDMLIDVIRTHLKMPGMPNLVPCVRNIRESTASIVSIFIALCKPERTYSGFRLDLVTCIKITAYLLFGMTCLKGVRVDIWGDACVIGKIDITRIVFRLLVNGISAQSSDIVFCFAGKFTSLLNY